MSVDDNYTKLLMHFNGSDGSTTFVDESGRTITVYGNAQIDTAQSVFGGASGLFDGTGDYLTVPDSDDWQLDGGSNSNYWTIDFWVRWAVDPGTNDVGLIQQFTGTNNFWVIRIDNGVDLSFVVVELGTITVNIANSFNPVIDTWYHIAVVKNGTSGYMMFVNGAQVGSTQTDTSVIPNFSGSLVIGRYTAINDVIYYLNGWMDELRISKGIARWTANFTPPISEYGIRGMYWYD